ncbi:WbqC family protein [Croceiramulus getboli]|nr:WbqC family protein [Flavobacteriaceae bacterium YJPT1-3]
MVDAVLLHPTYGCPIPHYAALVQAKTVHYEAHGNYQKQSFRNRMHIATANGQLALHIPIKHSGTQGHQAIQEVHIENEFNWQRNHWRSLEIAYRSSPFFEFYEDDLRPLYSESYESLYAFNLALDTVFREHLDIRAEVIFTTAFEKSPAIADGRAFAKAKTKNKPTIPAYSQVFEEKTGFIPHCSTLDLLFNLGPQASSYLKDYPLEEALKLTI